MAGGLDSRFRTTRKKGEFLVTFPPGHHQRRYTTHINSLSSLLICDFHAKEKMKSSTDYLTLLKFI